MDLPDTIILQVFHFLNYREIVTAGAVCKRWNSISKDEILWKRRFLVDFKVPRHTFPWSNSPSQRSWYSTYKQSIEEVPSVLCQTLTSHTDEVLHVSYSHDGSMFCTCSKDGTFKVWSNDHPCRLLFDKNMRTTFNWVYLVYSDFNTDDSLLLINGVVQPVESLSGETAIFEIKQDHLLYWCHVSSNVCTVNNGWFGKYSFLTVQINRFANFDYADISLKKVFSITTANTKLLARVPLYSRTYIRLMLVTDVVSDQVQNRLRGAHPDVFQNNESHLLIFATGQSRDKPHLICFSLVKSENSNEEAVLNDIEYMEQSKTLSDASVTRYLHDQYQSQISEMVPEDPTDAEVNFLKTNFDSPDYVMDMRGTVIGMTISRDKRYLFVNVRQWSDENPDTSSFSHNPTQTTEHAVLRVLDLETLELLSDKNYQGHKGFVDIGYCYFYLHMDSCENYISSGSADKIAYIWNRDYCVAVAKLKHNNIVNSVAFNPKFPETLVSVCDDYSVKIWRSKRTTKLLRNQTKNHATNCIIL